MAFTSFFTREEEGELVLAIENENGQPPLYQPMKPGESYRGLSYKELKEHGSGLIDVDPSRPCAKIIASPKLQDCSK